MKNQVAMVDGLPVEMERRRYGRTTYTWCYLLTDSGERIQLGDPWPCLRPKNAEVRAAIERVIERRLSERGDK